MSARCALIIRLIRELSATRDEAAAYRLIAQEAMHSLHGQRVELERMRVRYYALLDERRAERQQRPAA
jgi:hypothetical protein